MIGQLIPEWHEQAACRNQNPEWRFPQPGHKDIATAAKHVCAACTVTEDCLKWARDNHERFGIWGGVAMRGEK